MRAILAAVLACAVLCTPAFPRTRDGLAEKLLAATAAAARSAKSLTADLEMTWKTTDGLKRNVGTVRLVKPNYALIRLSGDYPLRTLASDGASVYSFTDQVRYTVTKADPRGVNIDAPWWGIPFRHFFTQSFNPFGAEADPTAEAAYVGEETVEGERYRVVEVSGKKPMPYSARFYVGADNLVRRTIVTFGSGPDAAVFSAKLTNVRLNTRLTARDFHFAPPANARLDEGLTAKLLAIGAQAPEFTLPTPGGDRLTLSELRRGKKATLVNFWYLACPPCRKEFPMFQKLYDRFKGAGLAVVAVNKGDSAQSVNEYLREERLTVPVALGEETEPSVFSKYAVGGYPVSYLLDAEGHIVYRSAGLDEAGLHRALEKLGMRL
jgi:peroxiredoxin/outer membrane lipoprotein-sorting protein